MIKYLLITLYLAFGLILFILTVRRLGGMREAGYSNVVIFVIGAITVSIAWPIFLIVGFYKIHKGE